jgi:hypothetical protein
LKMHVAEQIRQMWQKYVATRWCRDAAMNSIMLPPQRATAMRVIVGHQQDPAQGLTKTNRTQSIYSEISTTPR